MKLGLIARGNNRGLGILSMEFARHLKPARTLLIQPDSAHDAGLQLHSEWFSPKALHTRWSNELDEMQCHEFLRGLDVVLSFETFYDWRFCDWARTEGVKTVCYAMPEYFKHCANTYNRFPKNLPAPDAWWNPTSWRQSHMPEGTRVVPVPIPTDRFTSHDDGYEGPPRWLHVAGARAHADRNGTLPFLAALKLLRAEHRVIIRSQGEALYGNGKVGRGVRVEVHSTELTDYWDLYEGADALVMPRRYGGLCMPALEAMGAGLALVMPDVSPNADWPIIPIAAPMENVITTSAGKIDLCAPEPADIARKMDWFAKHPAALRDRQQEARDYARSVSWEVLEGTIWAELGRVLG